MSYLSHQTAPPLDALVASIWSTDEDTRRHALLPGLIAPDAHVEFVFQLGAPCEMLREGQGTGWEPLPAQMVFGQRSGCVRLRATGRTTIVGFRTSAVVADLLLGRPMHGLWDAPAPHALFAGAGLDALCEQLHASPPSLRLGLVERWLCGRLRPWTASDARMQRIHQHLLWNCGQSSIRNEAAAMGLSQRSLRRWMHDATGLAPKQIALSGRVLRACALLRERPRLSVTAIAQRLGFADHAAFCHAFRARTATTPAALRAEPLVFYERG